MRERTFDSRYEQFEISPPDDGAGIATFSLRTATDRFKENIR